MVMAIERFKFRALKEPDIRDPAAFLDRMADSLVAGQDVQSTMDELSDGLWWIRKTSQRDAWLRYITFAQTHRLAALVHQDPFTYRSFAKPRGFAGDAPLLDMIYWDQGHADLGTISPLGMKIYDRNKNTPAPSAVRVRRDFVASLIDEVSDDVQGPTVMSAACGHLREAGVSKSVRVGRLSRFVAVDQDSESLAEVARRYGQHGVEPIALPMKAFLGQPFPPDSFDLIYAQGLYDYLDDRFAERLTLGLFNMLRPGGRLVVGNFTPGIYDVGYMETYMGWSLIYRDGRDMLALSRSLPDESVSTRQTYMLSSPDIVYLDVRKRKTRLMSVLSHSAQEPI